MTDSSGSATRGSAALWGQRRSRVFDALAFAFYCLGILAVIAVAAATAVQHG